MSSCPCGSHLSYETCCGPLHEGGVANSAEALMRSRYSAFALRKIDYIHETTDPQTRAKFDREGNEAWARSATFKKLEILAASGEGNKAQVEFKATYEIDGQEHVHHERSRFRREGGRWYFRDGKIIANE